MRPVLLLLLFGIALSLCPASARVGETLDQCKKRYGRATPIPIVYDFGDKARDLAYYDFEKNGIAIEIGFLNGVASDLSFHHIPAPADATAAAPSLPATSSSHATAPAPAPAPAPPTPANADQWTQVEIDTLLADNAGDMQWKTVTDGKLIFFPDTPKVSTRYGAYQQRDDGVMATVDGPALHIFTPDWLTYVNAQMLAHNQKITADQKKNLEGF